MTSSQEKTVDLISDSDDEVECIGKITCSEPKKPFPKPKTKQQFQTPSKKRQQLGSTDKKSTPCSSQTRNISCPDRTPTKSLVNPNWNGFAGSRQRTPNTCRTPSPCTKEPASYDCNASAREYSSGERQRKRLRDGSVIFTSKHSCSFAPKSLDCGFDEVLRSEDLQQDVFRDYPLLRGRKPTEDELDHGVIILNPDDDLGDLVETSGRDWNSLSKRKDTNLSDPGYIIVDLDDNEDRLFEEVRRLHPRESPPVGRSGTIVALRNVSVAPPWVVQEYKETEMGRLKCGDVVELKPSGFFRISIIMKNLESDTVKLRGYRLERSRELNGVLPKKMNELYWNMEIEVDDPRPPMEQSMEEVDLAEVHAFRKVIFTNKLFPSASFRETGGFYNGKDIEYNAPCVVRWRYSSKYLTAGDRWRNRWNERCVEQLKEGDLVLDDNLVDPTKDINIRSRYRGYTVLGGAYKAHENPHGNRIFESAQKQRDSDRPTVLIIDDEPETESMRRSVSVLELADNCLKQQSPMDHRPSISSQQILQRQISAIPEVIDLSDLEFGNIPIKGSAKASSSGATAHSLFIRSPDQKYTYGDCFCGAGGATRGAVMAGLKPVWGFDMNIHACNSWRLNFPDAAMYEEWADQFIQRGLKDQSLKVDILHLSPPCQYFSPAHTMDGKDDEMNMASLFACGMLLDVAKPRIATLEQTFGIVLLPRFQTYFNALILMFTDRGFSVRWKIAQLQNWGLPQRRQRLIVIASCPGEVLPEFPPFTHSDPDKADSVLPPWVSVNSVIRNIPRGTPNHDLELMETKSLNCLPWSGDSITPRCITTHGGHNYHPSGKRGFTNREYACLQGFPMNHRFSQMNVKKQIGNAVPPCIAKVLFSWIRKALEKADGIQPEDAQAEMLQGGNFRTEAILLD